MLPPSRFFALAAKILLRQPSLATLLFLPISATPKELDMQELEINELELNALMMYELPFCKLSVSLRMQLGLQQ